MEVKSRRQNEKEGVPVAFDTAREKRGVEAAHMSGLAIGEDGRSGAGREATGMAFYFLRLCRLTFIEHLCSASGTVARCLRWIDQRRTGLSARPSAPWRGNRRAGGWGKSPIGERVEERGTTREVVAGDA